MSTSAERFSQESPEANLKRILEWLSVPRERMDGEDARRLCRHLRLLSTTPLPADQRLKLLELLYIQAERAIDGVLPHLHEVRLPVPRRLRQRVKTLLEMLGILAQDYLNTLAELFNPDGNRALHSPHASLRRAIRAIAWQIEINHLAASPAGVGLWQQLHATYRNTRRLGLEKLAGPADGPSIERIYSNVLLAAIAQPASFSSAEQKFINDFIASCPLALEFHDSPPSSGRGIFWIDPERDFPAHALIRRSPPADGQILYFCADRIADIAERHRLALAEGRDTTADLPDFASTHAGQGVLRRLAHLWGQPARRRFPRRRQSYRALLCCGLDRLWHLLRNPEAGGELSEWMVTNESPDGYALMHMSGETETLRIGDIVALQPENEHTGAAGQWQVSIIRWAISENPEHVELGLQLLAPEAVAAEIALPHAAASGIMALILPEMPPIRPTESLVVASGTVRDSSRCMVLVVERENVAVREIRATQLDEQTSMIEVFSVSTDDSP